MIILFALVELKQKETGDGVMKKSPISVLLSVKLCNELTSL